MVEICDICDDEIEDGDGYDCEECEKHVCEFHWDSEKGCCTECSGSEM